MKTMNETIKEDSGRGRHNNIIDIQQEVGDIGATTEHEQGCVQEGSDKANHVDMCGNPLVPRTGSLFKPIEGLEETIDMMRTSGINETR